MPWKVILDIERAQIQVADTLRYFRQAAPGEISSDETRRLNKLLDAWDDEELLNRELMTNWEFSVLKVGMGWPVGTAVFSTVDFSGTPHEGIQAVWSLYADKDPGNPSQVFFHVSVKIRPPGPGGSSDTTPIGGATGQGKIVYPLIKMIKGLLGESYVGRIYVF